MRWQNALDIVGGVVLMVLAVVLWRFDTQVVYAKVAAVACGLYAAYCFWRGFFRRPPEE